MQQACRLALIVALSAIVACGERFRVASGHSGSGGGGSGGSSSGEGGSAGGGGSGGEEKTCAPEESGCVIDWAGVYGEEGDADGAGDQARFRPITAMTGDGTHLYVTAGHAVRRIAIATAEVETIAGASDEAGYVDGDPAVARFDSPAGIALGEEALFVADSGNHVIRRITEYDVTVVAGSPGESGFLDGFDTLSLLSAPHGLAFEESYLYVADRDNHAIRRIMPFLREVVTLAGGPDSGSVEGASPAFDSPTAVLVQSDGSLLVSDTGNHRVRHLDDMVPASASPWCGTSAGYSDGPCEEAELDGPRGLTADSQGRVYVADAGNHVIRAIASGEATTIAGTPGSSEHRVGVRGEAGIDTPVAVHLDVQSGDLFIAEGTVIRRMYLP